MREDEHARAAAPDVKRALHVTLACDRVVLPGHRLHHLEVRHGLALHVGTEFSE